MADLAVVVGEATSTSTTPTKSTGSSATPAANRTGFAASVRLEPPLNGFDELWWRTTATDTMTPGSVADAALLAVVMPAMANGLDIVIDGAPVSSALLANLTEAQRAWSDWQGWRPVQIQASSAGTTTTSPPSAGALAAYSGGVDSTYTLWRHLEGDAGHQRRRLDAAMFVSGFDIPLGDPTLHAAIHRALPPIESRGVPVVVAETNIRDLHPDWQRYHGFALASMLTFAGGSQQAGLVAASDTYARPMLGWGSNPITDHLLSSDGLQIVHDGCTDRVEKVRAIAEWPDALDALRFCWMGPAYDRNCGRCLKCITMAMILRTLELEPSCFDHPVSVDTICAVLRSEGPSGFTITYNQPILDLAVERGITEPWVPLLLRRLRRARLQPAAETLVAPLARRLPARRGQK